MALAALLTACSADNEAGSDVPSETSGQLICFDVMPAWHQAKASKASSTRTPIVNYYDDFLELPVQVSALFHADESSYFADQRMTYNNTTEIWSTDKKYYWPLNDLDFYAHMPYNDTNLTPTANAKAFNYTTPTANSSQNDFMYAVNYQVAKTNEAVQLNFLHALSAISFRATTEGPTVSVVIKGIRLCNVKTQGTFTYPSSSTTGEDGGPVGTWSLGNTLGNLEAGITETTLSSAETLDVTSEDGVMTLIPQNLATAWDMTGKATEQAGGYLVINCRLIDNGFYMAGSADTFGDVYVPFSGNFEQGKHYTYTLTFGIGYDVEGKQNQIHLTMESTIIDWNRETINFDKFIL